jgi:DNA-binding HxlR family transcriptional regulator
MQTLPPLRRPPIASARQGLDLLKKELNREILTALGCKGPMTVEGLVSWLLLRGRSAAEEHLEELLEAGALERSEHDGATVYRLTAAGRGLVEVVNAVIGWLLSHPKRPLDESSPIGWRAFAALADAWNSAIIEWVVRRSPTEGDAAKGIAGLNARKIKKELRRLRGAGLIGKRKGRDGEERYRLTDWGRRGIGVLVAAAAWEQAFVVDRMPISVVDAVVALLGALPLMRLPEDVSGLCTLTASVEPGDEARPRAGMVWAKVRHGRVVACGEGAPGRDADAWISGTFNAWLAAVIDNRDALQAGGDRELAGAVIAQAPYPALR